MKNDKELYDDEIEEKKRTVVYVLKYLASVFFLTSGMMMTQF